MNAQNDRSRGRTCYLERDFVRRFCALSPQLLAYPPPPHHPLLQTKLPPELSDRQILPAHPPPEINVQHVRVERGGIAADADQEASLAGLATMVCSVWQLP